jgi:hypothetical protein
MPASFNTDATGLPSGNQSTSTFLLHLLIGASMPRVNKQVLALVKAQWPGFSRNWDTPTLWTETNDGQSVEIKRHHLYQNKRQEQVEKHDGTWYLVKKNQEEGRQRIPPYQPHHYRPGR